MNQAEIWRLFWAVNLPPEVKTDLGSIIEQLKPCDENAIRWVHHEGIHVTMKFLGDTDTSIILNMVETLAKELKGIKPFQVSIGGFGAFPNARKARIIWVGVTHGFKELANIANISETTMEQFGYAAEHRPFKPHLTLGRVKFPLKTNQLDQTLHELQYASKLFDINEIALMRSHLSTQGAQYEKINSITL